MAPPVTPGFEGFLAHLQPPQGRSLISNEYVLQPLSIPTPPAHAEATLVVRCAACNHLASLRYAGAARRRWYQRLLWSRARLQLLFAMLDVFLVTGFIGAVALSSTAPAVIGYILLGLALWSGLLILVNLLQVLRDTGDYPRIQDGDLVTGGEVVAMFLWRRKVEGDKDHRLFRADRTLLLPQERWRRARALSRKAKGTVSEAPVALVSLGTA